MEQWIEKIAEEAFEDELEKISAETSEVVGTGMGTAFNLARASVTGDKIKFHAGRKLGRIRGSSRTKAIAYGAAAAATLAPLALGLSMGKKTKLEMEKQDKAGVSNILLAPLLSSYRLGRRIKAER